MTDLKWKQLSGLNQMSENGFIIMGIRCIMMNESKIQNLLQKLNNKANQRQLGE